MSKSQPLSSRIYPHPPPAQSSVNTVRLLSAINHFGHGYQNLSTERVPQTQLSPTLQGLDILILRLSPKSPSYRSLHLSPVGVPLPWAAMYLWLQEGSLGAVLGPRLLPTASPNFSAWPTKPPTVMRSPHLCSPTPLSPYASNMLLISAQAAPSGAGLTATAHSRAHPVSCFPGVPHLHFSPGLLSAMHRTHPGLCTWSITFWTSETRRLYLDRRCDLFCLYNILQLLHLLSTFKIAKILHKNLDIVFL